MAIEWKSKHLDAGKEFLVQDATNNRVYRVNKGWIYTSRVLLNGKRQILSFDSDGTYVGYLRNLDGSAAHSATALTDVMVEYCEASSLSEIFRSDLIGMASVVEALASRIDALETHLLSVGQRSALQRIAWFLIQVSNTLNLDETEHSADLIPFSQNQMAMALGLSLVHTNKSLAKMQKSGLIDIEFGKISIRKLHDLRKLSDGLGVIPGRSKERP